MHRMKLTQRATGLRRRSLLVAVALLPAAAWSQKAASNKPITLVSPLATGGAGDAIIRFVAQKMSTILSRPVIVENKPGAGAVVAASQVARSVPDGSTLLIGNGTAFTITPHLNRSLPYNVFSSFTHISPIVMMPNVLVAGPNLEAGNVGELIALAKRRPGSVTYASYGVGSPAHLVMEQLKRASGADMLHVPYKGGAAQMQALLAGEVNVAIDTLGAALPRIRSGQVKALAVVQPKRTELGPDIPGFEEAGYPGIGFTPWMGLMGPPRMDDALVAEISGAMKAALADPETQAKFATLAAQPWFLDSSSFLATLRRESQLFGGLITALNITPES